MATAKKAQATTVTRETRFLVVCVSQGIDMEFILEEDEAQALFTQLCEWF